MRSMKVVLNSWEVAGFRQTFTRFNLLQDICSFSLHILARGQSLSLKWPKNYNFDLFSHFIQICKHTDKLQPPQWKSSFQEIMRQLTDEREPNSTGALSNSRYLKSDFQLFLWNKAKRMRTVCRRHFQMPRNLWRLRNIRSNAGPTKVLLRLLRLVAKASTAA